MDRREVRDALIFAQARTSKDILGEGDTPEKTMELGWNATGYASDIVGHSLGLSPVACREGGSYCCYIPVQVSVPEVLYIAARVLETFTDEQREALARRIDEYIRATEGMTDARRQASRIACPLLVNGRCSTYEQRPIACRGWNSHSVERCKADIEHPDAGIKVKLNAPAWTAAANIGLGLAVALKDARLPAAPLELARALKVALEDPALIAEWRRRPHAFDPAAMAAIHPREGDAAYERVVAKAYRTARNRPDWKNPAHLAEVSN